MAGKFVHIQAEEGLVTTIYPNDFMAKSTNVLIKLPKGNTYFSIFNIEYQDDYFKMLKRSKYYKIIFKSPKAVNYTPDHGDKARNVLVIYEVRDNGKSSKS